MRRLLVVVLLFAPRAATLSRSAGTGNRRSHRHRRLQPDQCHRRLRRAGVHGVDQRRPDLESPVPAVGGLLRSSGPQPADPGVAGLTDPLDNSLWLARTDRWIHYQPDILHSEQGLVPEGIQGHHVRSGSNPGVGLFPAGLDSGIGNWHPAGQRSSNPLNRRRLTPPQHATVAEAIERAKLTRALQANAANILTDNRLRTVRYTAAARSFDNRGWYLRNLRTGGSLPA